MSRLNSSYPSLFSNKPRNSEQDNISNNTRVSDEVDTSLIKFIDRLQITDTAIIDEIKRLVSKLRDSYHTPPHTKAQQEAAVIHKEALTLILLDAPIFKTINSDEYAKTVISSYLTVLKGNFAAEKWQISSTQQYGKSLSHSSSGCSISMK